jgi:hypothetical protein
MQRLTGSDREALDPSSVPRPQAAIQARPLEARLDSRRPGAGSQKAITPQGGLTTVRNPPCCKRRCCRPSASAWSAWIRSMMSCWPRSKVQEPHAQALPGALARLSFPCYPLEFRVSRGATQRPVGSPNSRSGECHNSHRHKTAQAHQTGCRCWESGGDARGKRARIGNTPPFPQSRPRAARLRLGVSPAGSR